MLHGHILRWHKRSIDHSSKCDAFYTGRKEDVVRGVLYHIDPREKRQLDAAEGLGHGYDERSLDILSPIGNLRVYAYIATDIDDKLHPYDWYKEYVVAGARLHGLPAEYVGTLSNISAITDPDRERADQEWVFIQGEMERIKKQI